MKPRLECSLVVNVAAGDVPILRHTIPHMLASQKVEFSEVILVVDERPPEGRIAQVNRPYPVSELRLALDSLRQAGCRFKQVVVDYGVDTIRDTLHRWFGRDRVTLRCAGGTPVYSFLFGLDQAQCDFRIHMDSDMLIYDPGPGSWVVEGMRMLSEHVSILFVNQAWGPYREGCPRPDPLTSIDVQVGQRVTQTFSTRCFLFSMEKLRSRFLPMKGIKHPFIKSMYYRMQGRSPFVALEEMVAHRLRVLGAFRCELDRTWGYTLHAWDKEVFQHAGIDDVLACIKDGTVPDAHCGQYNLDYDLFTVCAE